MKYKQGDRVLVSQSVQGVSNLSERTIYKPHWFKPIEGIVIGFSFIFTGDIKGDNELKIKQSHKVIVVAPTTNNHRYIKPIKALEEDITNVEKGI